MCVEARRGVFVVEVQRSMAIQLSCSACGKAFTATDEQAGMPLRCPACGWRVVVPLPPTPGLGISPAAVPPPLPTTADACRKTRSYLDWFGWIGIGIATAIAAGGIFWLGGPPWGRPEETAGAAKVGDAVVLRLPDAGPVDLRGIWLARTDSSWNEVHDARRLRDAGTLNRLASSGLAFTTANGTRGVVVDSRWMALRVRLLDGPRVGEAGWVDRDHVARDPSPRKVLTPPAGRTRPHDEAEQRRAG
jgi:DNA-directed RNA polymerase subunit RPC12/RpoP